MRTMFTVVVLGLGAVLSPAEVQQAARIPRVGFLSPVNPPTPTVPQPAFEGFLKGLADLGYVEGRNIIIEPRFAKGSMGDFPNLLQN